ncbi:two-component regulator propeller domain-containing protein [Bacteroides sp. 519]|uniref:hybrid sensor histidine kinase/response regulator transcription factor n=1 Tax=Bacteroides sp. 519 TaxID=2302937 RepID=UPI0013D5D340|nr:two-component regulator propeller domain-containing protein [Bacteroides sp. 519]NDV58130.1 hybrid sensor histidine kinase/response regulator [Bacteroides sp. 519]
MIKRLYSYILFLYLFPLLCVGQVYKNIGIEDGLSSRRVYAIQKDKTGFMWFLTHRGIDRYDGKIFKQYTLTVDGNEVSSLQYLNWLYTDSDGVLWEISKRGIIFKYNEITDSFEVAYQLPKDAGTQASLPISYSFIDNNKNIWLCSEETVYLYNTVSQEVQSYETNILGNITFICQCKDNYYYIGTDNGIHKAELQSGSLQFIPQPPLDDKQLMVNYLHYDQPSSQLFIGTFQKGLYIFNLATKEFIEKPQNIFTDITITRIASLNNNEVLLATDGAGIYKLNTTTYETIPYIVDDYHKNNSIIGNTIADMYIDDMSRIWIANFPMGITVRDDRYSFHKTYTHSGNKQSLINNTVNQIFEDSEGDLWFATNNGVSFYNEKTQKWHSFLSTFNTEFKGKNNVFLSICEDKPGIMYVGGHSSHIYKIDKHKLTAEIASHEIFPQDLIKSDKYIRSIIKGHLGSLWIGGHSNLKRIRISQSATLYPDLKNINVLLEKDKNSIWVGTATGLYLLDKHSGKSINIELPVLSSYIYSLYQSDNGKLYIGTNGSGFLIYDINQKEFEHFHRDNSPLISNNIYTILAHNETIILSSESGLTRLYYPSKEDFHNWTREQGLATNQFYPSSGVVRKNGNFIFGTADGAIELDRFIQIPTEYPLKTIISELQILDKSGNTISLDQNINEITTLNLKHDQNIFSIRLSAINYDYPSDILFSWKLEGFYDEWTTPSPNRLISYANLNPGKYNLQIRTRSKENNKVIKEERSIKITVEPPFWKSSWFIIIYVLAAIGIIYFVSRLLFLKKQKKISEEKFEFFVNTAHDIRTPLTLVKAPLDEIVSSEQLTPEGTRNINTALRNVNVLLRLTNNLINFEHIDIYSSEVFIAEHELNTLMKDIVNSFQAFAAVKQITLDYKSNFTFLNVWFDKEKMDSIIRNIISNAVKYTPSGGTVKVRAYDSAGHWGIKIEDTGIGIPASEQKKIFKDHFRASNAINSKITGSGMGMVLVGRLVKLHKGKIALRSVEKEGTTIQISFPKGYDHFKKAHLAMPYKKDIQAPEEYIPIQNSAPIKINTSGKKILIVEDNDELRAYLQQTLGDEYHVQTCENGKDALFIVKDYMPELIISDIMMPEMQGDEMCAILKKDIDTSHIPIILLTALNDERNIIKGIQTGADEYIVKPFNIGILKATIANLLANRARLKSKFANLDMSEEEDDNGSCTKCQSDLDWKFISSIRKIVEDNLSDTEFNVETLCYHMNMSRTSLYNKIRVLTDSAPSDYIRIIKLNKAAEFLKEGTYSITEVSDMTGFSDAKYFREVFKKYFGVSPSKYKDSKEENKEK